MLLHGWIILDESQFYTSKEMLGIISSGLLVVTGIKIITLKTSVIATLKKRSPIEDHVSDATDIEQDSGSSDMHKKEEEIPRMKDEQRIA